ncbi:hypothetical protein [Erythrobacter donghaensis]|jgi:hypothetical protein|uniref:hypothetical protein n=1 Tax=Erythrobacter donghaensis TaxID=267135 RepID=UPI0009400239|nr:hypothetical protein [Erythrobacter donghaensis]
MEFSVENGFVWNRPDRETLSAGLRTLAPGSDNTFAIFDLYGLASPEFIQTACDADGFIIERREQEPAHHFRAIRAGTVGDRVFSVEEVITAFHDFAYGDDRTPAFIRWENMDSEVGL